VEARLMFAACTCAPTIPTTRLRLLWVGYLTSLFASALIV
jgi:hypothetical protein